MVGCGMADNQSSVRMLDSVGNVAYHVASICFSLIFWSTKRLRGSEVVFGGCSRQIDWHRVETSPRPKDIEWSFLSGGTSPFRSIVQGGQEC
jgi:hypothetical protein